MDTKVGKYQGSWSGDKERRVRKSGRLGVDHIGTNRPFIIRTLN